MATWQEVVSTIKSQALGAEAINDSLYKTLVETQDGRNHVVFIGHEKKDVVFTALVCKLGEVNLEALFSSEILVKINYGLGSIDGYLTVKHVAALEDMNLTELVKPLVSLAFYGDFLEKAITGGDAY